MHQAVWLLALAGLGLPGTRLSAAALAPSRVSEPQSDPRAHLLRFQVEDIAMPAVAGGALTIPLSIDGAPCTLQLEAHSLRADDFHVLVQDDLGGLREAILPNARTYRGEVVGLDGARVAASIADGRLSALILLDDGSRWYVEPLADRVSPRTQGIPHIIYHGKNVVEQSHRCGVDDDAGGSDVAGVGGEAVSGASGPMRIADIAFDADFEFYQANDGSVSQTVFDIENVMNGVSLLYESELNITYELTTIVIRDYAEDPYMSNDATTLLNQFKNEWNSRMLHVHRDVAHLMTGRTLDGGIIGIANVNHMCETCGGSGYALSQSLFSPLMAKRVCLTAHELGHNWGACHCDDPNCTRDGPDPDCGVMCSFLGGCAGTCTSFGERSLSAINSTASSAACLAVLAPPLQFPFCETFGSVLNNATWSYNAASSVSTSARNPPSPPHALRIDNCCTECDNAPDDIRTNFILLGAVGEASLLYHTQHAGSFPSAGSQLVVEYWSNGKSWIELNRVVSDGFDQTVFDSWVHQLPADALHGQARIRFRLVAVSPADVWYVDDVAVVRAPLESRILRVRQNAVTSGGGASWNDAYGDLQDALVVAACSGGAAEEIWVNSGTYKPDRGTGGRSSTFRLLNGVALLGGFAGTETDASERRPEINTTVLSGDIGIAGITSDDAYHVVSGSVTDPTAVLDGFTISGGRAMDGASDGGGGLRIVGGSPTIKSCVFSTNTGNNGGGIYVGTNSFPRFTNCTVAENEAFSAGGGMYVALSGQPNIDRCRFLDNFAFTFGGGILISPAGRADLINTVLAGNTGSSGGGIYIHQSGYLTLQNCTLSSNVASGSAGGIVNSPNGIAVVNSSILWGNRDSSGMVQSSQIAGAPPAISYTCIQGQIPPGFPGSLGGVGNIGDDPLFVDADGADNVPGTIDDELQLTSASPAIDMGDPAAGPAQAGPTDLDGNPRILCGRVDMGALEFGLLGDYNCDRTVNLSDFAFWSACMTGPETASVPSACAAFDFNVDSRVDLLDFRAFQRVFTGP